MGFGSPRRHYRRTDSTNERARELASAGAPGGTMVTAGEQSAGRGRQGRAWVAPAEAALLCSAVLRPLTEGHALLPLAVPIAICEAIEAVSGQACAVKWPNDIWIEGLKAAGVLIEARPADDWAVIGVGVNVAVERNDFPAELRDTATSIGAGATVEGTLAALCERLDDWVTADPDRVLESFRARDALLGRGVTWADGEGVADGLDARGNLLVLRPSGERVALASGEVHLSLD